MLKLLPYTVGGDEYYLLLCKQGLDEEPYADLMYVQSLTRRNRKSKKNGRSDGGQGGEVIKESGHFFLLAEVQNLIHPKGLVVVAGLDILRMKASSIKHHQSVWTLFDEFQ
ncbi:MAG: hypothetical protein H0W49_06595 [Nitrospirales bacterium]|nr:hypothetical protein [Nitrospirales bacterium]